MSTSTTDDGGSELRADVAVVGAGPAGLAAAVTAAERGASVVLLDAGSRPGGQYYRRPPRGRVARVGDPPAHRWPPYDRLERRLAALGRTVRTEQDTTVWATEAWANGFTVRLRRGDRAVEDDLGDTAETRAGHSRPRQVRARAVVVATGAYDRHLPFPGWDLPGVMSGGAAQALVKGSLTRPGRAVVVAGTGPFLLAVAATLLEARVPVVAVVEANDPLTVPRRAPAALPGLALGMLPGVGKAGELARFAVLLGRHRVPYLRGYAVVRAHGADAVDSVTVARVRADRSVIPGTHRRLECDTVATGSGFIAQTELLLQLGCAMRLGDDGGLAVVVDADQRTSVPGVLAAGETTGVGGADLALAEGLVAGAGAARFCGLGPASRPHRWEMERARRRIAPLRRFAAALHTAFPVRPGWAEHLPGDTVVCRCEEVSAAAVTGAVTELDACDPRTVKLFTRAGMGWCQGRICSFAVDELCRDTRRPGHSDAERLAAAGKRPVAAPVALGELAELDGDQADR